MTDKTIFGIIFRPYQVEVPMKIKEDIRPISYVKAHAADMLEQVNKTRRPVFVTQNGEAKAVLLDSESYEI